LARTFCRANGSDVFVFGFGFSLFGGLLLASELLELEEPGESTAGMT